MKINYLRTSAMLIAGIFGQTASTIRPITKASTFSERKIQRGFLKRAHQALLEVYFPFEEADVPAKHKELALQQGKELWKVIDSNAQLKSILLFFARLEFFSTPVSSYGYRYFVSQTPSFNRQEVSMAVREVRDFLRNTQKKKLLVTHIADLSVAERRDFLNLLSNSPLEWYRRVALSMRILYVSKVYHGELGNKLADVDDIAVQGTKEDPQEIPKEDFTFPKFNTPLVYHPESATLEGHFDYLIIGSGVAGSMLAYQLQKAGKSVVMLEKGPMVHPWAYDARNEPKYLVKDGMMLNQIGDTTICSAEIAGGGSTINFDMAFPVTDPWVLANFAYWRENGFIKPGLWSEEDLVHADREIMDLLEIRQVDFHEVNDNNNVLLQGATQHGKRPRRSYLSTVKAEDQQKKGYKTNKNSAVNKLLWPALTNQNGKTPLTLLVNADVTRVLFEGKQAVGAQFRTPKRPEWPNVLWDLYGFNFPEDKELTLYADKVILAAGALGSTVILKKSKVKNPSIGKGIVCHPILPIAGFCDDVIDNHKGVPSSVHVPDYLSTDFRKPKLDFMIETSSYPVNRYAMTIPGIAGELYHNIKKYRYATGAGVLFMDEVDPNNRIEVTRRGKPRIFYSMTEADRKRFSLAVAETCSILLKGGVQKLMLNINQDVMGTGPGSSQIVSTLSQVDSLRKKLDLRPSTAFMYSGHIMCSNKIGVDPASSVINGNHEVWGYKNLHVCDSSIFPTSVSANPMMSIYAIAYLFSKQLLQDPGPQV